MRCSRRSFLSLAAAAGATALSGCRPAEDDVAATTAAATQEKASTVDLTEFEKLALDSNKWNYDATNDVWWQIGLPYCLSPASETYEQLAIYVPGAYMKGDKKGSTWATEIQKDATVGSFTAENAPYVMALNPGDFSGQASASAYSYEGMADYLSRGYIYVYPGFRGKNNSYDSTTNAFISGGAPWGLIDLKAAIRTLRYNAGVLPGNTEHLFAFGYAGSGALAALLGSSGDATIYDDYLDMIEAPTHDAKGNTLSDALYGVACWCPTGGYLSADTGYEWFMGQYATTDTRADDTWTKQFSSDMAAAFATSLNDAGLVDSSNTKMELEETTGGIYVAGSFYEALLGKLEEAASTFVEKTSFPYTPDTSVQANGNFPGDGNIKTAEQEAIANASAQATGDKPEADGQAATTYQNLVDYIGALNSDYTWFTYSSYAKKVSISDIGSFVKHCRQASRSVGAFDALNRDQVANQLFGNDDNDSLHFDSTMLDLLNQNQDSYAQLTGWDASLIETWQKDLAAKDAFDHDTPTRVCLYDPLYFLSGAQAGFGKASVAAHWRINTGLFQPEATFTTEMMLALALGAYDGVSDVAFTPVWGKGKTLAEVEGKPQENFLAWAEGCLAKEA